METLNQLFYGFSIALAPENLVFVFLGVLAGTIIGLLPGLGPMSAIALLIPIAYGLDATTAMIMLAGVYYGAIFGGSTSSILLNAPGVASTVATSFDGYPMARKGYAGKALATAAVASFIGGTISVVLLMLVAPQLSRVAVAFGPAEYFALMVLGLTAVVSLSGQNLVKGLIAAVVGVMIALVGTDSTTPVQRFTFGLPELYEGIEFLIVALGLFALAEVFALLVRRSQGMNAMTIGSLWLNRQELGSITKVSSRQSLLGFFIGVLPGAGATVASFLGYASEKKLAKDGHTFGKGNIKGLTAPESANNSAAVGSFVPLLTLGVPGSGTTAILLGALMVLGIQPGPLMLSDRPEVFWGIIASMYIGNIVLLVLNLPLIPLFAKILKTPPAILLPLIVVFCVIGIYGLSFSIFDLFLLLGFGIIGYLMRQNGFPLAPLILGVILGGLMERSMRQALQISHGDWSIFLSQPISAGLLAVGALSLASPLIGYLWRRRTGGNAQSGATDIAVAPDADAAEDAPESANSVTAVNSTDAQSAPDAGDPTDSDGTNDGGRGTS
ncbi:tripartite tricarboxylate transporter permease [Spiractinospora alimapuensis]|uniref:tripartite tricarboxylate transporter permease n=1 Tax=Spiractinospora alimapuensis TaxID=2820884 RepID=UPI001F348EAB|nr:tripartite tricarboxylate transporter permease [Spiractinospora alimapuensis]QVQ54558.1 tripartite tricarboxylate transporter permease [Spiractinospora alimapuensis]